MSQVGEDSHYRSALRETSDPKSPTWRYKVNASGVPLAGTLIGIQGCQWITTCCSAIIAAVNYRQKRGGDHHSLIKETADLWRSAFEGNQETQTWFRTEVEAQIDQFVTTEDQNILMLMQSTMKYCLLRLYLSSNAGGVEVDHNEAIKLHLINRADQDPDEATWSTHGIFASARSASVSTARTTTAGTRPAPTVVQPTTRTAGGSGAGSRVTTRTGAAVPREEATGGSGAAEQVSAATTRAAAEAGTEDMDDEVNTMPATAVSITPERSQLVVNLLRAIQSQDPNTASHLTALMQGTAPTPAVVMEQPTPAVLTRWATSHGIVKPTSYKECCETGGFSGNTYLYWDAEAQMVKTITYEPWDILSRLIKKLFLKFRCSVLTNTCMTSYRTTQLGVLLCGAKVKEDTYACLLCRCNEFLKFAGDSSSLVTVV